MKNGPINSISDFIKLGNVMPLHERINFKDTLKFKLAYGFHGAYFDGYFMWMKSYEPFNK